MLIFILCRDIRGLSTVTDIDIRHTYVGLKTDQRQSLEETTLR